MFTFIHSGDWQLGARFKQFGSAAPALRQARLDTLDRVLEAAATRGAHACLIAGDLFEDNQVDDSLVAAVLDRFRAHPEVPIYILPGNHDPHSGPDSVWQRRALLTPPAHVHILREAGIVDMGGAWLVASPLHQKQSTTDPSFKLVELARTVPPGTIKIGLTHGALAIEAKHQPNDFPIALNAASRADLDYLAVGHWHNWLADTDGGRIVMPGTPEPDRFANDDSGHVAWVEIDAPKQPPRVQKLSVATLTWRAFNFDFLHLEASRATLSASLSELAPFAPRSVVRVTLSGTANPTALAEVRDWLDSLLTRFLIGQVHDETRVALTGVELADLQARHPILAQVLADIDRLETFACGTTLTTREDPTSRLQASTVDTVAALTLSEAQHLLGSARIDLTQLSPEWFTQLRQTLLQSLREATS